MTEAARTAVIGVVTVSDRASAGVYEDKGRPAIVAYFARVLVTPYRIERRVIPVSPNCFYAYLQVIVLGLRGLGIEASARAIQDNLSRLGGDLARVQEHMAKLGGHLGNAQKQFTEAERSLARFETKLEAIGDGHEDADGQRSLLPP